MKPKDIVRFQVNKFKTIDSGHSYLDPESLQPLLHSKLHLVLSVLGPENKLPSRINIYYYWVLAALHAPIFFRLINAQKWALRASSPPIASSLLVSSSHSLYNTVRFAPRINMFSPMIIELGPPRWKGMHFITGLTRPLFNRIPELLIPGKSQMEEKSRRNHSAKKQHDYEHEDRATSVCFQIIKQQILAALSPLALCASVKASLTHNSKKNFGVILFSLDGPFKTRKTFWP